jgi:tripartite-type tricarboxylate transporter receptor subunit TctC
VAAWAQGAYPNRPIKFIVPWPAGGSADIAGRLYADFLSKELGQPVVVENRPGAGANLGVGVLAKSPADGYTLGQVSIGTQSINQFIYPALGFDPVGSFEHIGLQTKQPNILLVKKDSPFKTLQELVAYAKSNPES